MTRFAAAAGLPGPLALDDDWVIEGDNLAVLPSLPGGAFDMVYIDPPFNTWTPADAAAAGRHARRGGRTGGLPGPHVRAQSVVGSRSYADAFGDYAAFIAPRLEHARRVLAPHGTLYFHIDYREAHYCKVLLDEIFGRDAFLNEIIWVYDYGARTTRRWPPKHDTILVYVRDPAGYHFDSAEVDREPYMAPGLVTPEKAARGKRPTTRVGGTPSWARTAARRRVTPRRSRRGRCAARWRRRRVPAAGAGLLRRGLERSEPSPAD